MYVWLRNSKGLISSIVEDSEGSVLRGYTGYTPTLEAPIPTCNSGFLFESEKSFGHFAEWPSLFLFWHSLARARTRTVLAVLFFSITFPYLPPSLHIRLRRERARVWIPVYSQIGLVVPEGLGLGGRPL